MTRNGEGRPESAPRSLSQLRDRKVARRCDGGLELIGDLLPDVVLGFSEQAADESDADSWRTLAMRLWTRRAYAELGLEAAA